MTNIIKDVMNAKERAPARRPTMMDVAKAARVSQSTVSMVMNNMAGTRLSAATRSKVRQIAADLGYRLPRREPVVLPLGTCRSVIGYLVDEISTSPHPVVSVDGARDAAWAGDCILNITVTRNNTAQETAAIAALQATPGLLGVIYSTTFTREVKVPEALHRLPTVLLNCYDDMARLPSVVPGEVAGGHTATEYLISQGHTRIGFINGEAWMEAAQDRLKGYRQALATADLPFDVALVREGDWMSGSGYDAALSLMRIERPPTAIFCANDLMAIGALEGIRHLRLRVPEDVSVMGYDDQEIARHTHPPLTTVMLPNYEMGRTAVEMLLGLTDGRASQLRRAVTKVDCPLLVRASVLRA